MRNLWSPLREIPQFSQVPLCLPVSMRCWSKPLSSLEPLSSQNHFHQKTTFIKKPLSSKNHFHQKPLSSKTTFIKNQFHQRPFSSKTNFIKNQFHQRPLPVRGTHHPSKNNIVRVCVKASRAEGPRRLHTNTAYAPPLESQPPFC